MEGDAFFLGVFDGIEFRDFFGSGDDEHGLIGAVGVVAERILDVGVIVLQVHGIRVTGVVEVCNDGRAGDMQVFFTARLVGSGDGVRNIFRNEVAGAVMCSFLEGEVGSVTFSYLVGLRVDAEWVGEVDEEQVSGVEVASFFLHVEFPFVDLGTAKPLPSKMQGGCESGWPLPTSRVAVRSAGDVVACDAVASLIFPELIIAGFLVLRKE